MTLRIAMWSGPRNISTAMMRSFENRADTAVVDTEVEVLKSRQLATRVVKALNLEADPEFNPNAAGRGALSLRATQRSSSALARRSSCPIPISA